MTEFQDIQGIHSSTGKALIIGCGVSARRLRVPEGPITIGLHDCARHVHPESFLLSPMTYMLVYDKKSAFTTIRREAMEATYCERVLIRNRRSAKSWMEIFPEKKIIWTPGRQGWNPGPARPDRMYYGKTSVDPALHFAEYIGCKDIAIVGMDFHDHIWSAHIAFLEEKFTMRRNAMEKRGCRIVNLSPKSLLKTFPFMSMEDWIHDTIQ